MCLIWSLIIGVCLGHWFHIYDDYTSETVNIYFLFFPSCLKSDCFYTHECTAFIFFSLYGQIFFLKKIVVLFSSPTTKNNILE